MKNKPIGIFDSGLGGLTCLRQLHKLLPNENIIYFGDTGRVPYGNRSNRTITKYANQDVSFLLSKDVKAVIAACGTVSSVVTDLDKSINGFFTGVLKPVATTAVKSTKNGIVGVIGTSATIASKSYEKEIGAINSQVKVIAKDCPLFVPLVENGFSAKGNEIARLTVEHYLKDLKESGIDTLILGCTHYPILRDIIADYLGDSVTLIDSGAETAKYCANYLEANGLLNETKTNGKCEFYVSDTVESFSKLAGVFLGEDIKDNVYHVDIQKY